MRIVQRQLEDEMPKCEVIFERALRMFRHGSRSFSRHIVCCSEVCVANHRRDDSFGTQCRYEPSPNILNLVPGSAWRQVGFPCF